MIERYRGIPPRRIRLHGDRLAAVRNAHGHSLSHVGKVCGITRQAVENWESERTLPDDRCIDLLIALYGDKLANVLDVKVWE